MVSDPSEAERIFYGIVGAHPPDQVLSESAYHQLTGPCVYAWVRDKTVLYVCQSATGLRRLITHNVIDRVESVLPGDQILVWSFAPGKLEAMQQFFGDIYTFEARLQSLVGSKYGNQLLREPHQVECLYCGKSFMQKRWW